MDKMNTAEYLKSKRIIASTDLETRFNLNTSRDGHIQTVKDIVAAFDELAQAAFEAGKIRGSFEQKEGDKDAIDIDQSHPDYKDWQYA